MNTSPDSLPTRLWQNYSHSVFNGFTSSVKLYLLICVATVKEVITLQVLFPVIIHCCSYREIPLLGTEVCHSPLHHPTRLGWTAVVSVWFFAVVVLISYCICNRVIKMRCTHGQNFFSPPRMQPTVATIGLLEQAAIQHLSALAYNVAGAGQGDLRTW